VWRDCNRTSCRLRDGHRCSLKNHRFWGSFTDQARCLEGWLRKDQRVEFCAPACKRGVYCGISIWLAGLCKHSFRSALHMSYTTLLSAVNWGLRPSRLMLRLPCGPCPLFRIRLLGPVSTFQGNVSGFGGNCRPGGKDHMDRTVGGWGAPHPLDTFTIGAPFLRAIR